MLDHKSIFFRMKQLSHLAVVNPESVRGNLDHLRMQTLTHLSATVRHQH